MSVVMGRADLHRSIAFASGMPALSYQLPLYQAALAGRLDLAYFLRETPMPRAWRGVGRNLPIVAGLIDTVGRPAGPTTWKAAMDLCAWAEIAVLHRAGAAAEHYYRAAELAKTHMRTWLIAAPAETFESWRVLLHKRSGVAMELLP